ncbi:hypothetical protein [Caldicellulosiruptor saccharolyticus]|nr:hypothetical protein [Caldicellulosiruptor saccharolyticus]
MLEKQQKDKKSLISSYKEMIITQKVPLAMANEIDSVLVMLNLSDKPVSGNIPIYAKRLKGNLIKGFGDFSLKGSNLKYDIKSPSFVIID